MKNLAILSTALLCCISCSHEEKIIAMNEWTDASGERAVTEGQVLTVSDSTEYFYAGSGRNAEFVNFEWRADVMTSPDAYATIAFHTDGSGKGYEIVVHNGAADGTKKTDRKSTRLNSSHCRISRMPSSA